MAPSTRKRAKTESTAATTTTISTAAAAAAAEKDDSQSQTETPSYYLLKSEPHEFSIDQLEQSCPDQTSEWDGIRNYQARNILRTMRVNDMAWFYHSSCKEPGIVGKVRITRTAQPDGTALDPSHKYYDEKSTRESCRWDSVQIQLERRYPVILTLSELRAQAAAAADKTTAVPAIDEGKGTTLASKIPIVIAGMKLLQTTRLSVQPVTVEEWNAVEELISRKEQGEQLFPETDTKKRSASMSKKKKNTGRQTNATASAIQDGDDCVVEQADEKRSKSGTKATKGTKTASMGEGGDDIDDNRGDDAEGKEQDVSEKRKKNETSVRKAATPGTRRSKRTKTRE